MREYDFIKHYSESGKMYEINFNFDHTYDNNAGSDADGGRGRVEHYYEDYEIESVISEKGIDIYPRMNQKFKDKILRIVKDGE